MPEPKFEDPPADTYKASARTAWRQALGWLCNDEYRGRWVKLGTYSSATIGNLQAAAKNLEGANIRLPEGDWEFASRKVDAEGNEAEPRGYRWLYARWLG